MKNILKLSAIVLWVVTVLTLLGCTNAADEQATAESETAVANARIEDMTTQASQLATGTAQAVAVRETAVSLTATSQHLATTTAEAEATAAAIAATATAEIAATATQIAAAEATKEADAAARATAQANVTATAQAVATATTVAINKKSALVDEAKAFTPVYGPRDGELVHIDDDFIEASFANVNVRNFLLEATFAVDLQGVFKEDRDIGFQFRYQDEGAYRLVVVLNGDWELTWRDEDGFTTIEEGHISDLNTDGRNSITLYADGPNGFFFVNGRFVAELNLINWQQLGDISVGVEFFTNHESDDAITQFEAFTVWPLEEITVAPGPQVTQAPPGFGGAKLRDDMNNLRITIEQIGGLLDRLYNGETQSCAEYLGYFSALQNRVTYSGLPVEWQGIYNEYTFAAENIIATNQSVKVLCDGGGGVINDLDYGIARQGIGDSLNRINQAIQAANALLNG
ncbi:MAG: hypothetical protein DHS20C20_29650 [Ardenticatenaceae bacterium]|nr:MAG: hypothetical protein DHS20C20_29650 [Ardenticatenaceae bacterium]